MEIKWQCTICGKYVYDKYPDHYELVVSRTDPRYFTHIEDKVEWGCPDCGGSHKSECPFCKLEAKKHDVGKNR